MLHGLRYPRFPLEPVAPVLGFNTASNNFASLRSLRLKMFAVRTMILASSGMLETDFGLCKFHRLAFLNACAILERSGSFIPLLDLSFPFTSASPKAATPDAVCAQRRCLSET